MNKEKIILSIISRIVANKDTYTEYNFGSDKNKLYIDGCTEYLNKEEKEIIEKWINEIQKSTKETNN